jgi:hypothetical protein
MKTNISMNDVKFYIQPEKRKIICVIKNTEQIAADFLRKNSRIDPYCDDSYLWNNDMGRRNYLWDKLLMPDSFTGIATCAPEDEWDEETGKRIAFHKAKYKLNKSMFKRFNLYVNTIDKWLSEAVEIVNDFGEKLSVNTDKRQRRIDEMTK